MLVALGGAGGLRFADPLDGWAFGPQLWATHDGGRHWTQLTVPGSASWTVVALEAARGVVHAVLYDPLNATFRIASSPVGSDQWTLSSISLLVGAGPVPRVQLVLAGTTGWVLQNDRVVTNGARLVAGVWRSWKPVCTNVAGPAFVAASNSTDLVAACDVGEFNTPLGERLFVSSDGGLTFGEAAAHVPDQGASGIASPDPSTIVIEGAGLLVASFNGGGTWTAVTKPSQASFTDLGFTTSSQGVVVTSGGKLLMTRNGGHTWAAVTF